MNKIVIITGLTCSGKSDLAIEIAKKYNGEIISADSVQIYKGLNIGSAKVDKKTLNLIPHHLIDIRDFTESFNVGDFLNLCKKSIDSVLSKNKTPIIVGGTGLYIKALLSGYSLGEKRSADTSEYYYNLAITKGNDYVWDILYKLNAEKAKTVHKNNLKRVIRYIEIENSVKKPAQTTSILSNYEYIAIGIVDDREKIYNRINNRVNKMLENGLFDEVQNLIKKGATRDLQSMNSIGYKEWFDYFDGKIDKQSTIDLIKQHTRNYCKRQLTFLKTIPQLQICNLSDAKILIEEFLNDNNK